MKKLILLILSASLASCSSADRISSEPIGPPPAQVSSVVFVQSPAQNESFYDDYVSPVSERTRFAQLFRSYQPDKNRARRIFEKGMTKVARVASGMNNPTMGDIVDKYDQKVEEAGERYGDVERTVTRTLGIREGEFRTGVAATAATTAATLGALHMFQPVALSDELFGTGVRAGYDLSRLDDPKMLLSYGERLGVTLSRKGLGGSLDTESGYLYSADLNIVDQSAAASVQVNRDISLGTLYEHRDENVKGYVQLQF